MSLALLSVDELVWIGTVPSPSLPQTFDSLVASRFIADACVSLAVVLTDSSGPGPSPALHLTTDLIDSCRFGAES